MRTTINIKKVSLFQVLLAGYIFVTIINASLISFYKIAYMYSILVTLGGGLWLLYKLYSNSFKTRLEFYLYLLTIIFFLLSSIKTNNYSIISLGILMAIADRDFKSIIRVVYYSVLVALFLVITASIFNLIPNYSYTHFDRTVFCYGFNYYSAIPFYLFFLTLMHLFLYVDSFSRIKTVLLILFQVFVYYVFTVRLTFYLGLFVCALILLFNYKDFNLNNLFFKTLSILMFPVSLIVTFVICWYYPCNNDYLIDINTLLANRLSQAHYALYNYPITLLGQSIEMHGQASIAIGHYAGEYFYIDSGYIYSLLVYGLITTVLVMLLYSLVSFYIVSSNQKELFIWALAICVFSFVNNILLEVAYNPLLLLVPTMVKDRSLLKRKDDNVGIKHR